MENKIFGISTSCEAKLKEKGSIFISKIFNVRSVSEAESILKNIRKEYYDATHHCFAYKIYEEGEKYSDDGEPSGTAGIRILNALNHFGLTNVLAVVIRYFGGTKLGVGPLGKAYYQCVADALANCRLVELREYYRLEIKTDYNSLSGVYSLLNKLDAKKIKTNYEDMPVIIAFVESSKFKEVKQELINITKNNSAVNWENKKNLLVK